MRKLTGRILTPSGWVDGTLTYTADGRIAEIIGSASTQESAERYLLPGFMDLHVHGGGGADIMEAGSAAATVARAHARHGTTSMLATTMTAPHEDILQALQEIGQVSKNRTPDGARILGVHLEGPYINPGKLGAQPPTTREMDLEEIEAYRQLAPIRLITLAPEIAGHQKTIQSLKAMGIMVQLGHSLASYEQGVSALNNGASGFTHLFNAMSGLHHREPGLVGAALAHAEYAEIIPDLLHVSPGAIRVALRAIPKLYCVTDSTSSASMVDGTYKLGSQKVIKCMGGVRLADGTLAGSSLTMDQALRNLVKIGIELDDASNRLSRFPADYLGLDDRGRLEQGAWADIVALDQELNLLEVYIEGERVDLTHD